MSEDKNKNSIEIGVGVKILTSFKKLFASPKPRKKRRAVFFVCLFISLFLISISCHASVTLTQTQRDQLKNDYKLSDTQINDLANRYNDWTTVLVTASQINPSSNPDTFSASVNQFSPSAIGGAISSGVEWAVLKVVIGVLAIIAFFCKYLLMFAGWTLDMTLNPNLYNFTNNEMIVQGWIIVRDVCNLFFLLALLFIAICTILKIEKYHAKKTLLMLIIMALLINFSKPIAIFIFDGSQLLMNFFLSQLTNVNGQTPSTKFAQDIATFMYDSLKSELDAGGTSMQIAVYYLFMVVFLFMFAIALFVTAIFLLIRIVAVMFLIIVSPLAFFAAIIPDFSKMSSSWWNALFKYCYYGPAAAFFLLLGARFAIATNALPKLNINGQGQVIQHIVQYFTVLVFLYISIIMAQQFGIAAAGAIVGNANRFMKWAGGMGKGGGMWGWASRSSGITGGVSQAAQQSKLTRWMTKAGRQKNIAEREAYIAGKLGVTESRFRDLQKRSKERYKDADAGSVINRAKTGNIEAFLEAAERGDADDIAMLRNVNILGEITKTPGLRDHIRHLYRKNNQAQFAATLQTLIPDEARAGYSQTENAAFYANKELNRIDTSKIASVDWNDFAANKNHVPEQFLPVYKEALRKRLEGLASANPSNFVDVVSNSKGNNINFIMDEKNNPEFGKIIKDAKEAARQPSSGTGATTSTPPPNVPWS